MDDSSTEAWSFPIGRHQAPDEHHPDMQEDWISAIEALPSWLDPCIENLDAAQLDTSYRPGSWTINQVIHHLADAHMNGFCRIKLALTEDSPEVKPYNENAWATTPEIEEVPVNVSITLLHALHRRWGALLRHMQPEDWERTYYHPDHERFVPIWELVDYFAFHGRHHMEQIRQHRNRMGW